MFEGPVTALFSEDYVELHGLPGGRLVLGVGDSADLAHGRYVVQIKVIDPEQAKTALEDLHKVQEMRTAEESRTTWGGPG